MKYTFTIAGKLSNLNDYTKACRTNRFLGAKMKDENEKIVLFYINEQLKDVRIEKKVFISYKWYESNMKRDLDNIAFAKKFIQDALVQSEVLKNDGWKNISGFKDSFYIDKEDPRIVVEIEELEE